MWSLAMHAERSGEELARTFASDGAVVQTTIHEEAVPPTANPHVFTPPDHIREHGEQFGFAVDPEIDDAGHATVSIVVRGDDGVWEFIDEPRWVTVFDPSDAPGVAAILNGTAEPDLILAYSPTHLREALFRAGDASANRAVATLDTIDAALHYKALQDPSTASAQSIPTTAPGM